MSGLVFGILVARLLSGIVTEYTSWRNIYWVSFAAGNALYAKGGWTNSGALNIAQMVTGMLTIIARGLHEKGWIGWGDGWNLKDKKVGEKTRTLGGVSDIEANGPEGAGDAEQVDMETKDLEKSP
ncbi:hypothetical protein DL770_009829 [Monosporascus sp. CRB-9-2]|nr:hypothetical protein DL770_009829 [Monosporascus sp. CRB-9-2]